MNKADWKKRRTAAEIEQIVREFENSGLNRSQFCRQRGLTLGVLNRGLRRRQAEAGCWERRWADRGGVGGQKCAESGPASCGLAVVLGRGRRIAVSAGFDAATLQRLVQVLETT